MQFRDMQDDFMAARLGLPSLPFAGVIVYAGIAIGSLAVLPPHRNLILFLGFWMIMPVGAIIMKLRGEKGGAPDNPLFQLSALARWMVLATWAIHIPVWVHAPDLFPLTVGIAFGLHWVVMSWSWGNSVGLVHLAMRIMVVLLVFYAVPSNRVGAVCAGVSLTYLISILHLRHVRHVRARLYGTLIPTPD